MKLLYTSILVLTLGITIFADNKVKTPGKKWTEDDGLAIEITHAVPEADCKKAENGDNIHMHYTLTLENGDEIDSSRSRGEPFTFTLGKGQVIKGWDRGVLGMCEKEQRKLVIPSSAGYGDRGIPPRIPGKAWLHFDIELVKIDKRGAREL